MSPRRPGRGPRAAAAPLPTVLGTLVTALVAAVIALAATLVTAGAAQATEYRYWSFWQQDKGGAWVYATQGPSVARPDDGDVEGFRFAVSADSRSAVRPRGAADFDTICADTPARGGSKRIAVVVDFGTPGDAPGGETPPKTRTACARVGSDATTADALAAVAKPLRYNSSALLCAISGYPKNGCGEPVSGKESKGEDSGGKDSGDEDSGGEVSAGERGSGTADGSGDGGGPSVGLLAGVGAIVALGAAAVWQARRRRG
ncbi:SCO2322 family protein [Streptomyces typhae]|uniref:SCO2322 family protein n=1 Tax=Streptomyces typhae TaxID=2681492 RepID=UPI003CCC95CD